MPSIQDTAYPRLKSNITDPELATIDYAAPVVSMDVPS